MNGLLRVFQKASQQNSVLRDASNNPSGLIVSAYLNVLWKYMSFFWFSGVLSTCAQRLQRFKFHIAQQSYFSHCIAKSELRKKYVPKPCLFVSFVH